MKQLLPKPKRKFSNKTRERMRKAHLGKKHNPETIAKIRAAKKERDTLVAMGVLKPFRHSETTRKLLRKLALKQKRRHKLSRKDRARGAQAQRNKTLDRRLKRQVEKGIFNP